MCSLSQSDLGGMCGITSQATLAEVEILNCSEFSMCSARMVVAPTIKRKRQGPKGPAASVSAAAGRQSAENEAFARAAEWDLEQDYEQRPRKQQKKEKGKENARLPIKTAAGRVEELQVEKDKSEDEDDWLESDEDTNENEELPGAVEEEPTVSIRQQILDVKEELARVAGLINEDPEEHASGFRKLASIADSPNPTIKRLALATQLAVYKDAIPGYRIRPIAEADQTEKVSKEVRRLRAFEQTLVSSYQNYIKDLARCAKPSTSRPSESTQVVASAAILCACNLLLAVPRFNFRGDLLKILISKLSGRRIDADFHKCREAIENLFRMDDDGTSSLDAVGLITKMMKARNYHIHESVLNTFLNLRLLSEFSSKASRERVDKASLDDDLKGKKLKPKKEFRTKKLRKIMKERKAVEKEFQEADATVGHEQRDRMQSETLKLVFITYFRILKARVPELMGAVLEGLAKYAHLINQDFFGDLLETLKELIGNAETIASDEGQPLDDEDDIPIKTTYGRDYTREKLLCTNTAFALLEGQDAAKSASALHLDLTFFISNLYKNLHTLSTNTDLELSSKSLRLPDPHTPSASTPLTPDSKVNLRTTTVLLLRALKSILTPRTVPPIRLAAYTKQIYTSLLQLPEKSDMAMLALLTNVVKTHGRKVASLWNTEERKGDGVFDPLVADLEGSNPFASTIWEGELLKLHYAPGVRDGVKDVEKLIRGIR